MNITIYCILYRIRGQIGVRYPFTTVIYYKYLTPAYVLIMEIQMLFVPPLKVHLEISPESHHLPSEGFNQLKVSNALRYEVLTEILTSLGISCNKTQIPPLSPVHLLATDQVSFGLIIRLQGYLMITMPSPSLRLLIHEW